MHIRTRMGISADGYVTTPDGWPSLLAAGRLGRNRLRLRSGRVLKH